MARAMQGSDVYDYKLGRVIGASSAGTTIEWYDFYIFASLFTILGEKFFPEGNDALRYLGIFALIYVGFLVRPFGAFFFGRIGDLIGRKVTFMVTITLMGASTFAIGFLPTYETAGIITPILLVLLRCLQGLALGGEYGGAAIYVAEHVPDDRARSLHLLHSDDRDPRLGAGVACRRWNGIASRRSDL